MWHILSIIGLALVISVDCLGAGISYGMRKIRIPFFSLVIIGLCSGLVLFGAMLLGKGISFWVSPAVTSKIGALILILLGCWTFLTQPPQKPREWVLELKQLGIVIHILKRPTMADIDNSGSLSPGEAWLLGLALSLDALGTGIGIAMIGISPLPMSLLLAVTSSASLGIGIWAGQSLITQKWQRCLRYLPSVILIALGVFRFF